MKFLVFKGKVIYCETTNAIICQDYDECFMIKLGIVKVMIKGCKKRKIIPVTGERAHMHAEGDELWSDGEKYIIKDGVDL